MPNVVVSQLLFVAIAVQSDKAMTIQCSEGWKCAKDSTVANLPSGTPGGDLEPATKNSLPGLVRLERES